MTESKMNNVAEAEGYLRDLDSLDPPEAYVAVVAAQAHATLAQAEAAAQMVDLQKALLATMLPSPTPQEQVKAAMEEAEALARALPGPEESATEEPEEFGSVVRAGIKSTSDRVLWLRGAGNYWFSETSRRAGWSDFYKPEVLRIGVGETDAYPHPEGDVIVLGPETFKAPDDSVISHKGENYYPTSVVITSSETRPDVAPEETEDYQSAVSDIITKLRTLRAEAITSERKNAYDVAIETVAGMQP